jgi:hypothetical protein
MAEKLKTFDFDKTQSELTTSEKAVYPWEDWLDGDVWQLTYGEDFSTHPLMMERIIRTRATGRKAKVRLRHLPHNGDQWGVIVLQRTDVPGPTQRKRDEAAAKRRQKREQATVEAEAIVKDIKRPTKTKAVKSVAKKSSAPVSKRPAKRPARQLASVG